MSLFYDTKRESYGKTRRVSAGAGITLVCKCGEYVAQFECAKRAAEVLGSRALTDKGDGLLECIPVFVIPIEDMPTACEKLSRLFSVALVDIAYCNKGEGGFALVHKIGRTAEGIKEEREEIARQNLEEIFGSVDLPEEDEPAQAKEPVNLDEF